MSLNLRWHGTFGWVKRDAANSFVCDLRDEVETAIQNQCVRSPIEKVAAFVLKVVDGFLNS